MSTVPTVRQVRRAVQLADGSVKYEIAATVVDPGDLPFAEVFVVAIADAADPKADTLARVATPLEFRRADPTAPVYVKVFATDLITVGSDTFARIASVDDLTALPRDRTVATRQGRTTYLARSVALQYDDLSTATAAYQALLARLSDLVTAWRTASGGFDTSPYQDYALPQTGVGVEDQLVAAYKTKLGALKTAQDARDALKAQLDACAQDDAANVAIYQFLAYDVAFLQRAQATATGLHATLVGGTYTVAPTVDDAVRTFVLDGTDPTSHAALLTKKLADLDAYGAKVRDGEASCAALRTQLLQAQSTVDAAQTDANAALGAVLAVCPTFDPTSVTP